MIDRAGDRPRHPFGPLVLLFVAMTCEGFDLQATSFVGSDLLRSLGFSRALLGPLLSASLAGLLVGSPISGMLGDRLGRKRILVLATILYGLLTLAAAEAGSVGMLLVLRFAAGLGLGGALPNALALAGELVSPARRASAATLVGIGISFGAILAGAVTAALMPDYGWRAVFLVGGAFPLLIALALALAMPESPTFLTVARRDRSVPGARGAGMGALLRGPMAATTLLIWGVFFAVLMSIYLLSGWTPLLLHDAGFTPRQASLIASDYHVGGLLGGVLAALVVGRLGWRALAVLLAGACFSLVLLAVGTTTAVTIAALVAAGFFVTGAQSGLNGLAAVAYPTEHRAKGLGWALGIGRLGAVAGPIVGGIASAGAFAGGRELFLVPLPLLLIAACGGLLVHRRLLRRDQADDTATA